MGLQTFWFCLIGVLWAGYFLLEGFDFGVGMLLPILPGRGSEAERKAMFQAIGPVWDGNEVWLVAAGGATFAAFPAWYATMFSGFYIALLLILVLLIVRVVSFEWREKSDDPRWRIFWLWANTIGSYGATLIWGITLANVVHGVPLNSAHAFAGNFLDLFSAYTVWGGIAAVSLFAFHGATYLTLRTDGHLRSRALVAAERLALPAAIVCAAFMLWTVIVAHDRNGRAVVATAIPAALTIGAVAAALLLVRVARSSWAFSMTAIGAVGFVGTIFTGLYPRVLVSHPTFANSLTIANAASGHYALKVITIVALIFTPLVVLYQSWTYYVFRQRIGGEEAASPAALLRRHAGNGAQDEEAAAPEMKAIQ